MPCSAAQPRDQVSWLATAQAVGLSQPADHLQDLGAAVMVMGDEGGRPPAEPAEPVLVGGQRLIGPETPGPAERGQVVAERVGVPGTEHA